MVNAITTLITVALMLSAVTLLAQRSFGSMSDLSETWKQMEVSSGEIARTAIEVIATAESPPLVDITLRNSGQTALRDFGSWDVIVAYYETDGTYHQVWLPYTDNVSPGNNQWTVEGLYLDASASIPEAFHPNILDPDEEMIIRIKLDPAASATANNLAVIATPKGVSTSDIF